MENKHNLLTCWYSLCQSGVKAGGVRVTFAIVDVCPLSLLQKVDSWFAQLRSFTFLPWAMSSISRPGSPPAHMPSLGELQRGSPARRTNSGKGVPFSGLMHTQARAQSLGNGDYRVYFRSHSLPSSTLVEETSTYSSTALEQLCSKPTTPNLQEFPPLLTLKDSLCIGALENSSLRNHPWITPQVDNKILRTRLIRYLLLYFL